MITEERAEAAAEFIRDNAAKHGRARGAAILAEYKVKRAKQLAYLEASGTSIKEREARAEVTEAVWEACKEHAEMVAQEVELRDLFTAANITYEIWRSQQANSRRGP